MHVFWWRKFNWIRTGTTQAVDSHQLRCLADSESKPILLLAGHDKYMNEHCVRYDHFSCSTLLNCLRLTPGGQLVIVGIFFHFGCSWSDSTADRQTEKYNIILSPAGQLQITADKCVCMRYRFQWMWHSIWNWLNWGCPECLSNSSFVNVSALSICEFIFLRLRFISHLIYATYMVFVSRISTGSNMNIEQCTMKKTEHICVCVDIQIYAVLFGEIESNDSKSIANSERKMEPNVAKK